jgi:hypothetical protein
MCGNARPLSFVFRTGTTRGGVREDKASLSVRSASSNGISQCPRWGAALLVKTRLPTVALDAYACVGLVRVGASGYIPDVEGSGVQISASKVRPLCRTRCRAGASWSIITRCARAIEGAPRGDTTGSICSVERVADLRVSCREAGGAEEPSRRGGNP